MASCPAKESCCCGDHAVKTAQIEKPKSPIERLFPPECGCGDTNYGAKGMRYIQPPVPKSFKPKPECTKSNENETYPTDYNSIYRKSFYPIDPFEAKNYRLPPIRPKDNVESLKGNSMETKTVSKLSYAPPSCDVKATEPIYPAKSCLKLGADDNTSFQKITTHKHDYVEKPTNLKRELIIPLENIQKTCAPLEKQSVAKQSYQPINVTQNFRPKAIKPMGNMCVNEPTSLKGAAAVTSVYKLSYPPHAMYLPLSTVKEQYPWAKKVRHQPPAGPAENLTTYRLSFKPNSKVKKRRAIYPMSSTAWKSPSKNDCKNFEHKTVYRSSYIQPICCDGSKSCKSAPIVQKSMIKIPSGEFENKTVYKMSFPGYYCVSRSQPILPEKSCFGSSQNEKMETLTTHKYDFMEKPLSRRVPIIPEGCLKLCKHHHCNNEDCCSFEKKTVSSLSYKPPDFEKLKRVQSFKPIQRYQKPSAPMDCRTTQKLSFMPIRSLPPKLPMPWIEKSTAFKNPLVPMERLTVQKMSYPPPGYFIKDNVDCFGNCGQQCCKLANFHFPKAGIVN